MLKSLLVPKVISVPKNFNRFSASTKFNSLMLQGFTFGVYNARLKLKDSNYKFRQSEIVTMLVVGELLKCTVSDLGNVLGYKNSAARTVLNRAEKRRLIYRVGGRKGRGHFASYSLTPMGYKIYVTLQTELGQSFADAKDQLKRQIIWKLNRPVNGR